MKYIFFIFYLAYSSFFLSETCYSQAVTVDSVLSVVIDQINRTEGKNYQPSRYGRNFYIEDVSTRIPIEKQPYGIYEFGLYGDDLSRWIMLYDATGYKIFQEKLNNDMLGEILEFLERNNCSESESFKYIVGVYNSSYLIENCGEIEIKQ